MKRHAFVLAAAALLLTAAAQAGADSLEEKREKKRKLPFLTKAPWTLDYDQARADAKKAGKPIFAYFTRSYSP